MNTGIRTVVCRVVLGVACLAIPLASCAPDVERPPHLILISLDTLNRSALRAYDERAVRLPAIDAFCDESVRFERAYSSASWTLPAHGSLFTGLYPDRHGATDRRVTLSAGAETLAEGLARRGYQTAGFTGGGYLDPEYGMARGFEHYESFDRDKSGPSETGAQLVERVRSFLKEGRNSSRPLFLFLHSYAVHSYYDVRPEIADSFPGVDFLPRKNYIDCAIGRGPCPPGAWRQMRRLYRAELRDFDRAFADLQSELIAAGIWDEAVVVFMTDHGEGFEPERGRKHHGGRLHGDQLHIPLLVRLPHSGPGVIEAPVSIVDVLPTLLDFAGGGSAAGIDGRSFAPLLGRAGKYESRPVFAMEHYFEWREGRRFLPGRISELPVASAVIDEDGWYIRKRTGPEELYDTESDPGQHRDVLGQGTGLEALRALVSERRRPRTQTPLRGESPALEKDLEDLGYVGEEDE